VRRDGSSRFGAESCHVPDRSRLRRARVARRRPVIRALRTDQKVLFVSGVPNIAASSSSVAAAVRRSVREHHPSAAVDRTSSGSRPNPTTSASIGASTRNGSAAPSTGTTRARAISFSRYPSRREVTSRTS
jgi:hypothetical protein